MKKEAHTESTGSKENLDDTSSTIQRKHLLKALREAGEKGISTIEARHRLNIIAPAPRIFELRHEHGCEIKTLWSTEATPEGHDHKVARYFLISEAGSTL